MKDQLKHYISESKADYIDIRIEHMDYNMVVYRGKNLETISSLNDFGGIVRSLTNGAWGITTFNNIEDLPECIKTSYENSKLIAQKLPNDRKIKLREVEIIEDYVKCKLDKDFREIPLNIKKELAEKYNDILLSHKNIISSNLIYRDEFRKTYYINSEGTYIEDERPDAKVRFMATSKDSNSIQRSLGGLSTRKGYSQLEHLEDEAFNTAKKASDLLKASTCRGGENTVILDPVLAGTFVHEAFGHLSESDHLHENEKLQEVMKLGKKIGPDFLNIIDDGSIEGLRGTHKYDDEGVKTRKNYLVKDGSLVGRLHSRQTAGKMNEEVTGNARSLDYSFEPIVRMTNTYIDNGILNKEDLFKGVKKGIYAKGFLGGNTAFELFTFSSEYAYLIEDGKITTPLRDVVLSGNLFKTLNNIDQIANDLSWEESGGCGKNGQSGLPTPNGSPHIKINKVIVGG